MPNFKEKLRAGQVCVGANVSFGDSAISELMAGAGLDFVWIDMEHAPLTLEAVQAHVMATQLGGATPVVRVPGKDSDVIKTVLDCGAGGIIVPMVCTGAEAQRAVAACRYPPEGIRGYGPRRPSRYGRAGGVDFCRTANEQVVVIVQIEHIDAVNNLDDILQTPGLDAVMIGPNDLSGSLGLLPQTSHPEVVQAIERVVAKAHERRVPAGIFAGSPAIAREWIAKGVQWVSIGWDVGFLANAIDVAVEDFRRMDQGVLEAASGRTIGDSA